MTLSIQREEGWRVSHSYGTDNPGPEGYELRIEREDCPEEGEPKFEGDGEAWEHVVARARAGSVHHIEALDSVSEHEKERIIAACGAWR